MKNVILLLGSNLGNKTFFLRKAIELLCLENIEVINKSSVYESCPVGYDSKNNFYNIAVEIKTSLSNLELLNTCLSIENKLFRKRSKTELYSDRTIDIDIILIENEIINTDRLIVPHPRMHKRSFCIVPINEIVPNAIIPTLKKTVNSVLKDMIISNDIKKLNVEL